MNKYEYTKMPLELFPQWTVDQYLPYNLDKHAHKGFVYILANKEGNLWLSTGRSPSKRATAREFETTWLLRGTAHTRAVKTQKKTNTFLTDRG